MMARQMALVAIAAGAAPLALAAEQAVTVKGPIASISASAGVIVDVAEGAPAVVLTGDARDFPRIKVTQTGDALSIARDGGVNWFGPRTPPKVRVSVRAQGLKSLSAASGATLTAKDIRAQALRLETSSGGDLNASGACASLTAGASSGSDLNAKDLICTEAAAVASSGADVSVHAKERISASASSGGDVFVFGAPAQRNVEEGSGGDVTFRP